MLSQIDYENILDAGFKNVELVPIHVREYYKTKNDFIALLLKTPILQNFSKITDSKHLNLSIIDNYIKKHKTDKGILLIRRYYGIVAYK